MSKESRLLFEEAMALDPSARADLAGRLIESLEPGSDSGVEEDWLIEIERRMSEIDSGEAKLISWDEVRSRLYATPDAPGRR
jgi:putative addiction module component (TIGR02574 family)